MKQLYIGNESIAFQSGAFFKDLTKIITAMRASKDKEPADIAKHTLKIDKAIYDHTGVSVSSKPVMDYDNAFVLVPALTSSNVLHSKDFNKFLKKNFNSDNISFLDVEKKGWLDPANSRVGGAFSEIVFETYVGSAFFFDKESTPEETAGVIIHEVGHAYTFLQFIADTIIVNNVLQRSYQELTNGNPDKKVKIILTKAAEDMRLKGKEWLESVNDNTDPDVAIKLLATAVQIEDRAVDNKRYFTMNACEELADIFAARHGAGRALVLMRSKNFAPKNRSYHILSSFAWIAFFGITFPMAPVVGAFVIAMSAITIALGLSDAGNRLDNTTFKQNATKIRNQFVENIKSVKLPKEALTQLLADIAYTDKLIQDYKGDLEPSLAVKFMDMFRRGKMSARTSREYTDKLEVLVANDLFIRAAQLGSA